MSIGHPEGGREFVRLSLALTTIGRSEQNVIELLDPKLSRFHCEIERRPGGYTVRDCNSRNGTLINGEPAGAQRPLHDGDRIKVGRTLLTFHAGRPPQLQADLVHEVAVPPAPRGADGEPGSGSGAHDTPYMALRRPTDRAGDRRNTVAVEAVARREDPWKLVAEATLGLLDATSRGLLLEETVERTRRFFQARGALLALGRDPGALTITAGLGLEPEEKERCLGIASRVLVSRGCILEDRRAVGVPIRSRGAIQGALVAHDLAASAAEGSVELQAMQTLADIVGRALSGSLLLEEVRREERSAGARRIAHDLRGVLRPTGVFAVRGLEAAQVTARTAEVGRDFWDHVEAPPRAGRREAYLAFGEVPDAAAPAPEGFRRSGERSFVPLLGQAELRGALRALVEVLPRSSDVLVQLNRSLQREGTVARMALALARFDPTTGALRVAAAGLPPALVRRADGTTELLEAPGPALGLERELQVAEREVRWGPGDQVLLVTSTALPFGDSSEQRADLTALLSRQADPALPLEAVAEALLEALVERAPADPEGMAFLLLRRT